MTTWVPAVWFALACVLLLAFFVAAIFVLILLGRNDQPEGWHRNPVTNEPEPDEAPLGGGSR